MRRYAHAQAHACGDGRRAGPRAAGLGLGRRRAAAGRGHRQAGRRRPQARPARTGRHNWARERRAAAKPWKRSSKNTKRRWRCRHERQTQRQAGDLLGGLLRRLRNLRSWRSTRRSSTWPRPSTSSCGPAPPTARSATSRRWPTASIDVCLFNGGIRTSEQEYMAQLMRRKSKVLVAFGSCASEGCIPGLAQPEQPQGDLRHGLQGRLGDHAGESEGRPPADRDARCPRARCTCRSSTTR